MGLDSTEEAQLHLASSTDASARLILCTVLVSLTRVGSIDSRMRRLTGLFFPHRTPPAWVWYGFALLVLIVAMGALVLMGARGGERISPFFPFYPAVLLATIYGGARSGVLATLLAAVAVSMWMPLGGLPWLHDPV